MVSLDGSSDEDGDDYAMHQQEFEQRSRYPLHDCCEFEDADTLRVSSTNAARLLILECCLPPRVVKLLSLF